MKYNIKNKAFTLVELLIVISITMILVIWASRVNFNFSTDKSRTENFKNKITAQIETARTNDLVWKWIWTDLIVPDSWEIVFSNSWSWEIKTYTYNPNKTLYNDMLIEKYYTVQNVECETVDWTTTDTFSSGSIVFKKWNYSLSGSCLPTSTEAYSNIKINIWYKNIQESIEFDTVNWLIKR